MLGECGRMGYSELFTPQGRSVILKTTCKTWGCVVCQKKLLSLFKGKVELGVSRLGRCAFMTTTYLAGSARLLDVQSVAKDWQALWLSLRRQGFQWKWLKVTELTAKGTPHHHIVLGPIAKEKEIRCHGSKIRKGAQTAAYIRRIRGCDCLAHDFARSWLRITGDSYMCFATPVTDAIGAAGYMAKYMTKGFTRGSVGRRYSSSRDWPAGERIRLRQTREGGWDYIRRWPAANFNTAIDYNELEADLLERVGDPVHLERQLRNRKRGAQAEFRKVLGR